MLGAEGKFSHLSIEERTHLAMQGKDTLSRLRGKERGGNSKDRLIEQLKEEHTLEIERISTASEEEKSRELSLLSEELTKHYKHHIEQLEHKLQIAMESSDVTTDETNLSRYKTEIEVNARTQVEQYYEECREEVEKLQDEITELTEERDQAIDDVNTLEADLNNYRSKLESVLQTEVLSKNRESDWERELMESAQRLQEADTKVGGLERMLQERESLSQLLTAERDEAREILANREMEKIALSNHFTQLVDNLEKERIQLSENVKLISSQASSYSVEIGELRELSERKEEEKKKLTEEFLRDRIATQECEDLKSQLSRLTIQKQTLSEQLSAATSETSELEREKKVMKINSSQVETHLEGLVQDLSSLENENTQLQGSVTHLTKETTSLADNLNNTNQLNRELTEKNTQLGQQLIATHSQKREREFELEQLLVTVRQDKTELSVRLSEAEQLIRQVNGGNDSLRSQLDIAGRELSEKSTENLSLRKELDQKIMELFASQTEEEANVIHSELYARKNSLSLHSKEIILKSELASDKTSLKIYNEESNYLTTRHGGMDRILACVKEIKQKTQKENLSLSMKIASVS